MNRNISAKRLLVCVKKPNTVLRIMPTSTGNSEWKFSVQRPHGVLGDRTAPPS
jgi:hypothetical protein